MKSTFTSLIFLGFLISACGSGKTIITREDLQQTTTMVLVRHAEKADDGTSNPGLTPIGQVRAQRLAAMLAPTGVNAVYSTPFERTRMTAKPLADLAKLKIIEYDPRNKDLIEGLLEKHQGETVLVVGHSNTIPMMVNALIGQRKYEQLGDMEYDKIFIVEVIKGIGRDLVLSF